MKQLNFSRASVMLLAVVLCACANKPLQTEGVILKVSPADILRDSTITEGKVLWGGVILSSKNLAESTQVEVLSYPLDYMQRPATQRTATGRFLVSYQGYLETVDYAPGRLLTISGALDGTETGRVGETDYEYVRVSAENMHLWTLNGSDTRPAFSFGIGINLSN